MTVSWIVSMRVSKIPSAYQGRHSAEMQSARLKSTMQNIRTGDNDTAQQSCGVRAETYLPPDVLHATSALAVPRNYVNIVIVIIRIATSFVLNMERVIHPFLFSSVTDNNLGVTLHFHLCAVVDYNTDRWGITRTSHDFLVAPAMQIAPTIGFDGFNWIIIRIKQLNRCCRSALRTYRKEYRFAFFDSLQFECSFVSHTNLLAQ